MKSRLPYGLAEGYRIASVGKPHHAPELPGTVRLPLHGTKHLGMQAFGCLFIRQFVRRVEVSPFVSQVACSLDVSDVRHIFQYFGGGRLGESWNAVLPTIGGIPDCKMTVSSSHSVRASVAQDSVHRLQTIV